MLAVDHKKGKLPVLGLVLMLISVGIAIRNIHIATGTYLTFEEWHTTNPSNMSSISWAPRLQEWLERKEGKSSPWPKLIHATTKNPFNLSDPKRDAIASCKRLNPGYEYKLFTDAEIRDYVSRRFPQFLELFDSLENQVMRGDLWRYLVLYKEGGVYLDTDVTCVQPIDEWMTIFGNRYASRFNMTSENGRKTALKITILLGVEIVNHKIGQLEFTQWTMYAKPGHSIFLKTAEKIQKICETRMTNGVCKAGPGEDAVSITGPKPFSEAVREHMTANGVDKDTVIMSHDANMNGPVHLAGDLGILNHDSFGCCWNERKNNVSSIVERHPDVLVTHGFFGSWRTPSWQKVHGEMD